MRRVLGHRFRRSTLYLFLFIGILCGLGVSRTGKIFNPLICLFIVAWLLINLRKRSILTLVLVLTLGIAGGWWRGLAYTSKLSDYDPFYYRKVTIYAVSNEDAIYNKYKSLAFTAGHVTLENGRKLTGRIQLSGFGVNAVFQGDDVTATGKLYPGFGP